MQYPSAFYNNQAFVDNITKIENIENDWKIIASQIDCSPILPHKNKTPHKPYQEYYDNKAIKIVEKIYAKDLECFGYRFEK